MTIVGQNSNELCSAAEPTMNSSHTDPKLSKCCQNGLVSFAPALHPPSVLGQLMAGMDSGSKVF